MLIVIESAPIGVRPVKRLMARKTTARDPFEVTLSAEKTAELTGFLVRELQYAEQARENIVGDNGKLDYTHQRYEGGQKLTKRTPWEGAANLGSWIVTEAVDALRARIVATLYSDPNNCGASDTTLYADLHSNESE